MLTEMQARAIGLKEGNALVSASAGSGKTFVMISRVTELILNGYADVDEILCVTFTSKAAAEMKQKLLNKLNSVLLDENLSDEKRDLIYKQLELLPAADISTVHAFCKNLLTEFFYKAGLDASFSVADDKESEILVNRAIGRLFDDLYEQKNAELELLTSLYFKKRSDNDLKKRIIKIYNELITERSPEEIMSRGEFYYTDAGVEQIIKSVLEEVSQTSEELCAELEKIRTRTEPEGKLNNFCAEISAYLKFFVINDDYDEFCHTAKSVSLRFPVKSKKDGDSEEVREELRAFYYGSFKPFIEVVQSLCGEEKEEEFLRAQKAMSVYKALCFLVNKFAEYYASEKREENLVDFSDLEHLTLKLLADDELREEISSRYKYVFADEYQDTNGVQEALLNGVSRGNLFMVGDVKQSIYNFRGCNPNIFADKLEQYESGQGGTALSLDKNFRSAAPVLNAVNNVFSSVMTKRFGRVDYKSAPMSAGGAYPVGEGEASAFFVCPEKSEKVLPSGVYGVTKHLSVLRDSAGFAEGRLAAKIILEVVGQEMFDVKTQKTRKIEFGDCAVLLRNTKGSGDKFVNELMRAGIPVAASSRKSIGDYPEIAFLTDLLRLIGCFNQDIPLVAVLKSPVGKICEGELLKIRQAYPHGTFCEAYRSYLAEKEDDLAKKLAEFEEYMGKIRLLSSFLPCDELLQTIIREKQIDLEYLSMRLGEQKLERINLFIDAVGAKKRTVQEFLPLMDKTVEGLSLEYSDENAVKIMSIHASKGLEFPVVILGGVNKKYNTEDVHSDMLIDKKYGLALKLNDLTDGKVKETLFRRFVRYKKLLALREDEARLFYVALTRAENRLIITGTAREKDGEVILPIKSEHLFTDGMFSSSFCDLLAQSDLSVTVSADDFEILQKKQTEQVLVGKADEELKQKIKRNLSYVYPFAAEQNVSVKRSVTSAAHFDEEGLPPFEYAPIYGATDEKTGTAYHKYLQLCDFSAPPETEVNRLIAAHLLNPDEVSLIKIERLNAIMKMPVFKQLEGYSLYKEQPFTAFLPASLTERDYSGSEEVLVQGIIDLLAVRGDQAVIVDYKFSALSRSEDLIARYQKQLRLYALAVEKVLKKRVTGLYIANIYSAKLIELPLE